MDIKQLEHLKEFNAKVNNIGATPQPARGSQTSEPSGQMDISSFVDSKLWAVSGDAYLPCEESVKSLPSAHYNINSSPDRGIFFQRQKFSIDDLLELPDSSSEAVIEEIEQFWGLEDHFRKYGFLWKRGMLLWGPPGSGKTCTLQIIANKVVARGGIAVSIYIPNLAAAGLQILRKIEPARPVVCLLEDVDAIIDRHGQADLLSLLDGERQIDNVVYIATTNYPERLDSRFANRPSRFDIIQFIGMPTEAARKVFLCKKSKILAGNSSKLKRWAEDTEGFSIAHLKELIISVEVFKRDYSEILERLKVMLEATPTSTDFSRKQMGFGKRQR